jgi:hypothetical protein
MYIHQPKGLQPRYSVVSDLLVVVAKSSFVVMDDGIPLPWAVDTRPRGKKQKHKELQAIRLASIPAKTSVWPLGGHNQLHGCIRRLEELWQLARVHNAGSALFYCC